MQLNIGIVGAGNFARFAAAVFFEIPGIKIVAVTDIDEVLLKQVSEEWDATGYVEYESFLEDKRIQLVYIATPPFLHYSQSKMALLKNKHVICEKPAALKTEEAAELKTLAGSLKLLWVVNLMQRYNPIYSVVKQIIVEKILGSFLHGYFENYASDENLLPEHWFWNETKSGGIFIEHAVHFFDMFSGWFGEGKLIHAVQLERPGFDGKIIDRVQATIIYKDGLVNFYHGFDQPGILDRQELRLQFEHGEITLYGWIPVKIQLYGLLKNEQLERLKQLAGKFSISQIKDRPGTEKVNGRFKEILFNKLITLDFGKLSAKKERYGELLEAMIMDQWKWIVNHAHVRVIDETNAVTSLKIAEEANLFAKRTGVFKV